MAWTSLRIGTAALAAAAAVGPATEASFARDVRAAAVHERTVEVRVVEHDRFRWADAGVGALAAVGLTLAAAGTAVALRGGRGARSQPSRGGRGS